MASRNLFEDGVLGRQGVAVLIDVAKFDRRGPVLAARIVAGRPYKSVDELDAVNGFGPKMLDKVRPHVFVSESE